MAATLINHGSGFSDSAFETIGAAEINALLGQSVDVSAPGYAIKVQWAAVSGATDVDVTSAGITVGPDVVNRSAQLAVTASGTTADVAVPSGVGLAGVTLSGLQVQDPADSSKMIAIHSDSDLPQGDNRMYLVVSIKDAAGSWSPFATAPGLGGVGVLPPALRRTSLQSSVLKLPAFAGTAVRFQVMRGSDPQSFSPQPIKISATLTAQTTVTPTNLQLAGPDKAVLWSFAGTMPAAAPAAPVDFGAALKRTLKQSLPASPPVTFTLSASSPASASLWGPQISGAFLRTAPGTLYATLSGDPAALSTAPPPKPIQPALTNPPLAAEAPTSVTADLRVKYAGVRILPAVNDQVPVPGQVQGVIVGAEPVIRTVPPKCLGGLPVAKIGLIGRSPEACSLTVCLVDMSSGAPGAPVGKPGIVNLAASDRLATVWIDMPSSPVPAGPIAVSVQSTQGRFFWVKSDQLLTRIAVVDPNPGGRPITIGSTALVSVSSADQSVKSAILPSGAFLSTPPLLHSELFATVTFSNLTLRYAR